MLAISAAGFLLLRYSRGPPDYGAAYTAPMSAVEHLIRGRPTDLGGFAVRRVLPAAAARCVGPFVFVDHMGPAQFAAGAGIDVRPHPHIGLATVTYLFEGEFVHRDSLGTEQRIAPGDVNWMIAGRGIVHSERTPADIRRAPHRAHGVQTWVALPEAEEDVVPAFAHHPAHTLPRIDLPGAEVTVIAGHAFGRRSPVGVLSPTLYCSASLRAGATLRLAAEHDERAVYVVDGRVDIDGTTVDAGTMAVLIGGVDVAVHAAASARVMLLGGTTVGRRFVHWNFVASTRERIEQARQQWARYGDAAARNRFGTVPGEHEFVPLPPG
jgi:redox-sensitive bicupin YhaK (pirin superfamily)